jgi:predicted acetyltransferase
MKLDLSKCRIRTPTGDALIEVYRMLMDVFEVDRRVLSELISTGTSFYTWTPYALYSGDVLVGNVSLMPIRIWFGGRAMEVVGVASVATPAPLRNQGIATHLLRHCLEIVDQKRLPAVLFTGRPKFYEQMGFKTIEQTYLETAVSELRCTAKARGVETLDQLDRSQLQTMARIYSEEYPEYDGKVIRDDQYWQLYQMLVKNSPGVRIVSWRSSDGKAAGYARLELERDRVLVSEFCCDPAVGKVAEALLTSAIDQASRSGKGLISFALPARHFLVENLTRDGVTFRPEPHGPQRETFMLRPPAGGLSGNLAGIQWSLADKF